ncbi:MAG TPA: PilZ domain-containing protein [Moraxellaceae bacterium]|nr:PilZ domain-containing protein [Moraxellaceae bacterium]
MSDTPLLPSERRTATRINSTLSLIYQRISSVDAALDPYDSRFELPRHFTLSGELARIDEEHAVELRAVARIVPGIEALVSLYNRKLAVLTEAIEGGLSIVGSPAPQRVNLSESGLSFHAAEPLLPGGHLHLAISNSTRGYHIAATGRVVFCEEEDLEGYRTGVAFVSLRDEDRETLARDVIRKVKETEIVEGFINPENG